MSNETQPSVASFAAMSSQALAFMLEEIDYGMVVVDEQLQVLHLNNAARRRFASGHAINVSNGHVGASSAADVESVRNAVLAAIARNRRGLVLLHTAGRREVYAVVPLQVPGERPVAMLLASRDDVCEALSWQAFARLHGLTPAEAAVLEGLCQGERPTDLAHRLGVAISTVRTQIASLRSKAGAQTIGDLIRELATLPPLLSVLRH
jgi:DNA-binding CsgD family transcriptional regulator